MRCAPHNVIRRSARVATCLVLAGAVGIGSASAATAAPGKKKPKWHSKKVGVSRVAPATTMPIDIGTAVAYERDSTGKITRIL